MLTTEFGTGTRVQIECNGWWSTLNWQYYSSTDTSNVDTMTQVNNIITAEGQFITGVSIDGITSGITSPAYREPTDRQKTAQAEAETLLAIGNTGGKRYMANVLPARTVVIEPEPNQDARYLINADGQLEFLSGGIVPPSRCIVGSVVGTRDMMANLTLKQVENYVGKDIAEKIQNEEGKVWGVGIVTGKQIGRAHV